MAKDLTTIAVTGLDSFIGRETVRRLVAEGHRVIGIGDRRPEDIPADAGFYKVDTTVPTADAILADIFKREDVRQLVHMPFLHSPSRISSQMHEQQVIGTLHLLHASAAHNLESIVVKSSSMVYGALPLNPNYLTEEARLHGAPGYRWVQDMVEVEHLLAKYRKRHPQARVTSLRMAPVLGPTVRNVVTRLANQPGIITLLGFDPLWQLLHEEDAVSAMLLATHSGSSGPVNIVGSGVLPLSSLIYLAGRVNIPVPHPIAYPAVGAAWLAGLSPVPAEHLNFIRFLWLADGERASRELGFTPTYSTRETLEQFAGVQRLRDVHLAA